VDGRNPVPVDKYLVYANIYTVSTIEGGAGFRNHPQVCVIVSSLFSHRIGLRENLETINLYQFPKRI